MKMTGGEWSRGDLLALLGIAVAIVGVVVAVLTIPGMPKFFHFDSDSVKRVEGPGTIVDGMSAGTSQKTAPTAGSATSPSQADAGPTRIGAPLLRCVPGSIGVSTYFDDKSIVPKDICVQNRPTSEPVVKSAGETRAKDALFWNVFDEGHKPTVTCMCYEDFDFDSVKAVEGPGTIVGGMPGATPQKTVPTAGSATSPSQADAGPTRVGAPLQRCAAGSIGVNTYFDDKSTVPKDICVQNRPTSDLMVKSAGEIRAKDALFWYVFDEGHKPIVACVCYEDYDK